MGIPIRQDTPAALAFSAIAKPLVRDLGTFETSTFDGSAEQIHQVRVSIRRLLAAISLFKSVTRDARQASTKRELHWLQSRLSAIRDLDTLIERIGSLRCKGSLDASLADLAGAAARERKRRLHRVMIAASSARFRSLTADLAEWIDNGAWRARTSRLTTGRLASQRLDKIHRKIRRGCKSFARLNEENRHRLRIEAKKARYAAEFFLPTYRTGIAGQRLKKYAKIVRALLKALGGLTDIVGHRPLLRELFEAVREPSSRRKIRDLQAEINRQQKALTKKLTRQAKLNAAAYRKLRPYWK